jgi:hypothetical protein
MKKGRKMRPQAIGFSAPNGLSSGTPLVGTAQQNRLRAMGVFPTFSTAQTAAVLLLGLG